jgi:hypothetical protein
VTVGRVDRLVDIRARHPEAVAAAVRDRKRCDWAALPERLFVLAADHPARGAISVNGDRTRMGDRLDLLDRLVTALGEPGVDGVLGTPDIIDDLALLGALDGKLVLGSMNRGGLAGSAWELDDRFTAYDAEGIEAAELDGGKMLLRLDYSDPGSAATLEQCARAVSDLSARGRLALVEPLPVARNGDGRVALSADPEDMMRAMGVASGLGRTSAYLWLKLPVVDDMARVMASTTLPTLLLGGDGNAKVFDGWKQAMSIPQVRGIAAGRALLYGPDGVVSAVRRAVDAVHG